MKILYIASEARPFVATGGLAKEIIPHCRKKILLDENLLSEGLRILYQKNQ